LRLGVGLVALTRLIIEGDVLNFNQLKEAIAGQDIVSANFSGNPKAMAQNIVRAMDETGGKTHL
jgi:hypothetical protein